MSDPEQLSFDFPELEATVAPARLPRRSSRMRRPRAELIPFPLAHRRPLVLKLADLIASGRTVGAGEKLLRARLARLARGLRRKGITAQGIACELKELELAVREEFRRLPDRERSHG